MVEEDYKIQEDTMQSKYLEDIDADPLHHALSSCRHLSRRFIHSANQYCYQCAIEDVEACNKPNDKGVANKSCLTEPYTVIVRRASNNDDDSDLEDK